MKKVFAVVATAILALGLSLLAVAGPASAHNATVTPSCSSLKIDLNSYAIKSPGDKSNTVQVTIDGTPVTPTTYFGASYGNTYTFPSDVAHKWSVHVVAYDSSQYNVDQSGTTTPCVTMGTITIIEPTCQTPTGSYIVPSTAGVTYAPGTGTYPGQAPLSTITVTAKASSNAYTYTGTSTFTHKFNAAPTNCPVTPVTPKVTTITACGQYGSVTWTNTTDITYALTSGDGKQGAYTVTATAHGTKVFSNGTQTMTFSGDLGTYRTCITIPHDPKAFDIICQDNLDTAALSINHSLAAAPIKVGGYIEVVPVPGVTYTITGGNLTTPIVIVSSGTAPIDTPPLAAGNYVVTATAANNNLDPGVNPFHVTIVDRSAECLSTLPFTSGTVTPSDQVCSAGKLVSGFITVALDPATLTYTLNGATLGAKTNVAPGTYTVIMTPQPGYTIDHGSATVTVHAATGSCQLITLAFTGGNLVGMGILSASAMLLVAGGLFVQRSRRERLFGLQ